MIPLTYDKPLDDVFNLEYKIIRRTPPFKGLISM
jgi:hypothetical protein